MRLDSHFNDGDSHSTKKSVNNWLFVGARVALCIQGKMVGIGEILSLDPKRLCHNVPVGNGKAYLIIKEALESDTPYKDGETLQENVGSFAVWEILQLRSLCPSQTTGISLDNMSDNCFPNSLCGHDHQMCLNSALSYKRFVWRGITVKLIDETGLHFANGNIHEVEIGTRIGDVLLCQKNVGVHFQDLVQGALKEHLRFCDTLQAWPLHLVLASDGTSLKYHQDRFLIEMDDQISKTGSSIEPRKYVFKSRKRKVVAQKLSRKEKAMTDESIRQVSSLDCCSRRCCQTFPRDVLKEVRVRFWQKTFEDKRKEKTNVFRNRLQMTTGEEIVVLEGHPICLDAWRIIHALGKTQFLGQKRLVEAGFRETTHGNVGKRHMTSKVHQGLMTMTVVINENADLHPAKSRTMADRTREVVKELPTTFSWERIRSTVNTVNSELGLDQISQPSLSLLRSKFFKEISIHKKGNNFSKCNICSELDQRKTQISCKEERDQLKLDIDEHHLAHTHGRRLYHAWRDESIRRPDEVLCIIHDKMDHYKTALPRFPFCPKSLDSNNREPITVTGILTHGHGPRAFAEYGVGFWRPDSNQTIGSLDGILRMLENPQPKITNLIEGPDSTKLFESLLMGRVMILKEKVYASLNLEVLPSSENLGLQESNQSLTSSLNSYSSKKLPRVLKLQLDNCSGDNKNKWVFSYLSLLTTREIFEEVHLGFLMVGHTHEDVDAMFAHFSEALKHRPAYSLPEMMSMFMSSRKPNPVPHFVQEVPDFKSFVAPFMLKGTEGLVGQKAPRLFRFYKRSDQMPCMQYKMTSMDEYWLPKDGVELWAWNVNGVPILPTGSPKRAPMMEMKDMDKMIKNLEKHVEFFERVANRQLSIRENFMALKNYWERIIQDLKAVNNEHRIEAGPDLQHGFWPQSRWRDHVPDSYQNVACQLEEKIHYVGPKGRKPKESYDPRVHICVGNMILVRPATEDRLWAEVFMGEVLSKVELSSTFKGENGGFEHTCKVQWYRPFMACNKERNVPSKEQRWHSCWDKTWEWDKEAPQEDCPISTVLFGFAKRTKVKPFKIPKKSKTHALDNLQRCLAEESDEEEY